MSFLFYAILLSSFSIATIQLAVMKNNWDRKWNQSFGLRAGNYCFLCVSFWLGCLITAVIAFKLDLEVYQITLCILAIPSLTMLIIKPYYHD